MTQDKQATIQYNKQPKWSLDKWIVALMKRLLLLILLIYTCINGLTIAQDTVADSIIALVNSARNQAGVSSLIFSPELTLAAQTHSNDMAENGVLDHMGSDGSEFWQRMQNAGYALTVGAENILLRADSNAQATYNQWRNSPSHQANMMNSEYVEIGVAYSQASDGTYYFTMLMGRRSGINPLPLPSPTRVPPTNTPQPPTSTSGPTPPTATLLPTQTYTATPLVPPTRTLSPLITPVQYTPLAATTVQSDIPTATPQLSPDIRLIYDDTSMTLLNVSGSVLDLTALRFQNDTARMDAVVWDTEFLTDRLDSFSSGDCLQVWGLELNLAPRAPEDCKIRHAWVAVNASQVFWSDTQSFLVANENRIIGQCEVLVGQCDLSLDAELTVSSTLSTPNADLNRDIRIIFSPDSMTILNLRDTAIDLRGLSLQSKATVLSIDRWNTEFVTASLSEFPANDCLMAWTFEAETQPAPIECETRHGWIEIGESEAVWKNNTRFDVIRDNRVLAGCIVVNGYCDVNLQGNLGDNSPTIVPQNLLDNSTAANSLSATNVTSNNLTNSSVTMIYSSESFSLINTSGINVDISSLVFESDAGVFSASRWDTEFLSRPLDQLTPNDCLQIWGVNIERQSKPTECNVRHSWVAVASDSQFWRDVAQFRVRNGSSLVGSCTVSLGRCSLNLP